VLVCRHREVDLNAARFETVCETLAAEPANCGLCWFVDSRIGNPCLPTLDACVDLVAVRVDPLLSTYDAIYDERDEQRYEIMKLNAVALATGFAGAALVVALIFAVPMQFSMMGAYGAHMPGGVGYGMGYGVGTWMLLGGVTWLVVAAAIAGAIVALIYNAIAKSS